MGKTSGLEIYKELNWEVSDRLKSLMDRRTWTSLGPAAPGNPRPGGLATGLFGSQEPHWVLEIA